MQELINKRHNKSICYRTLKYLIVQCIPLIFSLSIAAVVGALCTQIVHSPWILSLYFSCNSTYLVSPKSFEVLTFLNFSALCILFFYFLSMNHGTTVWPCHIPVKVKWCNTWLSYLWGFGGLKTWFCSGFCYEPDQEMTAFSLFPLLVADC
jgi:hypothetical protein